jgi:DNA-binding NarL/FixJ family response regulator
MFIASGCGEAQDDLDVEMLEPVFDVETAVRLLLQSTCGLPDRDSAPERRITFEVCIDGQPYTIYIDAIIPANDALHPHLSPRELDIARLIAKGLANKTIAAALGLRPSTVGTYTKRIYLKLNVNSRAEMVAKLLGERMLGSYPSRSGRQPN